MLNLKYLRLLPFALAIAARAQAPVTLTVTEVLRQQQMALTPPVLKVERAKTLVNLNAVYGQSDQLQFDVTINGLDRSGLSIGDTVKGTTGSCTIVSYSAADQCLQLGQVSRFEICPAKACWTGVRPSAALLPSTTAIVIPAISSLQPLPPQPARPAQTGVNSISPMPATAAINAPRATGGANP